VATTSAKKNKNKKLLQLVEIIQASPTLIVISNLELSQSLGLLILIYL